MLVIRADKSVQEFNRYTLILLGFVRMTGLMAQGMGDWALVSVNFDFYPCTVE